MTMAVIANKDMSPNEVIETETVSAQHSTEKVILGEDTPRKSEDKAMGAHSDFSGINEHMVLRKMDMRLIPMLAILYLLSFLDRGKVSKVSI